ncbi:MAG: hypothetical protein ACYDEY_08030, partial [Acidimicrobiales bacterium]
MSEEKSALAASDRGTAVSTRVNDRRSLSWTRFRKDTAYRRPLAGWFTTALLSVVILAGLVAFSPVVGAISRPAASARWSTMPTPDYSQVLSNKLNNVACISATFCVAVGEYTTRAGVAQNLILTWNGSTWSANSSASLSTSASQENIINGVSCVSSTFCVAVGFFDTSAKSYLYQNLILTWNGSTWSLDSAASLSTSASQLNVLGGVSCASSSFCVANGVYYNGTTYQNLILTWNGSTWSLDSAASLSPGTSVPTFAGGISCATLRFCVANGIYYNGTTYQTLILTWNGSAWSLDTASSLSPGTSVTTYAGGISCATSHFCVATGTYYKQGTGTADQNLLLTWNGSTWSLDTASSLSSSTSQPNILRGVSCASAISCVATGFYNNGTTLQGLVLIWNGSTWSLDDAASLSATGSNPSMPREVSCASSSFCVVGGHYSNGTLNQNLILTWNGKTWSLDSASALSVVAPQDNQLTGVSCTSSSFCVATGYYSNGTVDQNLLLTWNGSTWTLDSASSLSTSATQHNQLTGVSCTSPAFCVAGGYYNNGTVDQNLLLTWNGSTWSLDSASSLSTSATQPNQLAGISCASSTSCVAVGTFMNASKVDQTLVEAFNGFTWHLAASPDTSATQPNQLAGVSCASSTSCVAVGTFVNASKVD